MVENLTNKSKYVAQMYKNCFYNSNKPKFMSQLFCIPESIPKEKSSFSACKSLKLMLSHGFIKHVNPGVYNIMPLALRSLEKLCSLTDIVMSTVQGQKVLFPTLIHKELMKKTGRWENNNLFKLQDRNKAEYCLGPTHEEIATSLFTKTHVSYKSLPLRLYQISSKFRDEMNPKLGLLRGREFIMKDMYTFDTTEDNSLITYEALCAAYHQLFELLDLDIIKVKGSSGDIGGKSSHEFHLISDIGEDEIYYCESCKTGFNAELIEEKNICSTCSSVLLNKSAIEVGHAFVLGTAYSEPLNAKFDSTKHMHEALEMGCYGLGLSRILASSIEYLSDVDNIRWPHLIAPFYLSIIPPKKGSKEESACSLAESLSGSLNKIDWLSSNIIYDDRNHMTIGKRIQDASAMGVPYIVVVSGPALKDVPKMELIDVYKDKTLHLTHRDIIEFFRNKFSL